jgi:undecaprenyl-diphosphatase
MLASVGRFPKLITAVGWSEKISQTSRHDPHLDLMCKLAVATLPVVIVGFAGKDFIESTLRTLPVIATTTMFFGAALWVADQRAGTRSTVTWADAVCIGAAQALALIPGTSRSGITITMALLIGLNRVAGARFSFLLAIPTIAGAQLLLTVDLIESNSPVAVAPIATGALVAFISAYLSIHFFIQLLDRFGMTPYVVYRLLLGAALFWIVAQ